MAVEIERKFLVQGQGWRSSVLQLRFTQGYLSRDPARTVRVRIEGDEARLTVKGRTQGATRAEFEYQIPVADAQALLTLCDGPLVEKIRHFHRHDDGLAWEIDEFFGDNAGLVVAEIELSSETQTFARPAWLGAEVTGDVRYFNSNLAVRPYSSW